MQIEQVSTDRTWQAASQGIMRMEKITYRSRAGNLLIPAFVFQPLTPRRPHTAPALVWVHENIRGHLYEHYIPFIREATRRGYVVIAPDYRGSIGYGRTFYDAIDYGGAEVDDVVGAVSVLSARYPEVDPTHVGIIGWSHGGLIALLATFRNPTISFYTPEKEIVRQEVNAWIRSSAEFDAVIDFDEVLRDPRHPTRLLPIYDSGDHIHCNDAGYIASGNAIPLALFHSHAGNDKSIAVLSEKLQYSSDDTQIRAAFGAIWTDDIEVPKSVLKQAISKCGCDLTVGAVESDSLLLRNTVFVHFLDLAHAYGVTRAPEMLKDALITKADASIGGTSLPLPR
jgi:dienelactone hydrolase